MVFVLTDYVGDTNSGLGKKTHSFWKNRNFNFIQKLAGMKNIVDALYLIFQNM